MPFGVMLVYVAWGLYLLAFGVNHIRVRSARRDGSPEKRIRGARASDMGLLLQFAAVALTFFIRRPAAGSLPVVLAAAVCAAVSVWLTWYSLAHLGPQWRMRAVVTSDHELIASGPYRWVRHPVYTALLGMLAANMLQFNTWEAGAAAIVVYAAGTEIRIASEDRILGEHFPEEFPAYRTRTPSWLPPLR